MTDVTSEFRAWTSSRWNLLLAAATGLGSLVLLLAAALGTMGGATPREVAWGIVQAPVGFPGLFFAIMLTVMTALGALPAAGRPLTAFAGRAFGVAATLLATWTLPAAVVAVLEGGAFLPLGLATLVTILEAWGVLALFMLFAELGPRRGAILGTLFLGFVTILGPLMKVALISLAPGASGGPLLWQLRLGFLTPFDAAHASLTALAPDIGFGFGDRLFAEDHPILASPWLWLAVLAAWTIVPLLMLSLATRGGEEELTDADPTP